MKIDSFIIISPRADTYGEVLIVQLKESILRELDKLRLLSDDEDSNE